MNRRDFSLTTALLGTAGALGGLPAWAQQAKTPPQEGQDYVKLSAPVSLDTPAGKVEVLEFFWYSCPHCFTFEPMFANWVKAQSEHVLVRRVPIAFQQNGNFVPQQKLFYTLEGMKLLDKLHVAAFGAIQNERRRLNSDEAVFEWVKTQSGVDLEEFKKLYGSFSVASAVRRATQLQNDFGVQGVPSLGVAGKYYTDGTMSSSLPRALEVVDYLVEQERKRMG
ncbi:MAG: thiol:disulfide interchange protein DsbA/DsbL [Comamonadaceae bacterium]|nr:thiol:disulfide interchange protein DsbA/DsbL [Comamonadaceae bacterium]